MDGDADGQIFHFAKFGIRYGTDDKGHAAALILSCVLLFCAMIVSSLGLFVSFSSKDPKWIEIVLTWIGNAFLFTAGIAVGKGKGEKSN